MEALVIIDVQNGMFPEGNEVNNADQLLLNIKHLLKLARDSHTPIFYVQHQESTGEPLEFGTKGWEIHPEIAPKKEDVIIHKTAPDSFHQTPFEQELKKYGITDLVICGLQTELCVDTTCRRAVSMGYNVTLVADTHSTWPSGELTAHQIINHHNQLLRWFVKDVLTCREIRFKKTVADV
jgi:nicotinamidase-related amidase